MRVVAALGGNALLRRGERPDAEIQIEHVREAAAALAPIAHDHELIVCHGNGPQVGMLASETAGDTALSRPYPLDDLVAETQGMIGYWLARELRNAGVTRPVVAVVTQTVVDPRDPAFECPTKFVGPVLDQDRAVELVKQRGWVMAQDASSWRRVVASPEPQHFVEIATISSLLDGGAVVICVGGGGAPVSKDASGRLEGVEAVVDKDYAAALLAHDVSADALLLLTDVPNVKRDWGTDRAVAETRLDAAELAHAAYASGSMGPKVEGARRFAAGSYGFAAIGRLTDARRLLEGTAGTRIELSAPEVHRAGT